MIEVKGPVFNLNCHLQGDRYERRRGFFSKFFEKQSHGTYHQVDDYEPLPVPKMSVNWNMLLYRISMASPMTTEEFLFSVRIVRAAVETCLIDGSKIYPFKYGSSILSIASRSAVLTAIRTPRDIWPYDWGSYNFKRILHLTRFPKSLAGMLYDIQQYYEAKPSDNILIVDSENEREDLELFIRENR